MRLSGSAIYSAPRVIIVMGVSGSGKTTLGKCLAERLDWMFQEGDDLHPNANIAKMRSGMPLTDQDRAPWLANIKEWIDHHLFHGSSGVVTCSALKKAYRIKIIAGRSNIKLLYIKGCKSLVSQRLLGREGHFMPPNLLASQFADLEEPDIDEKPMILSAKGSVCDQADQVIRALALVDRVRQNP